MAVRINLFPEGPRSISILKILGWILSSMKVNSNTFEVKRIFLIYHLRLLCSMTVRADSQYLYIQEDLSRFPVKLTRRQSVWQLEYSNMNLNCSVEETISYSPLPVPSLCPSLDHTDSVRLSTWSKVLKIWPAEHHLLSPLSALTTAIPPGAPQSSSICFPSLKLPPTLAMTGRTDKYVDRHERFSKDF